MFASSQQAIFAIFIQKASKSVEILKAVMGQGRTAPSSTRWWAQKDKSAQRTYRLVVRPKPYYKAD